MQSRFESAVAPIVPPTYQRHAVGGDDWGIVVYASTAQKLWPTVDTADGVTAVSLGLPLGADLAGGPVALARRVAAGADLSDLVVPPFSMIACAADGTVTVAQDFLGMSRLFTGRHDGVVGFCSRPTLLAEALTGTVAPDPEAWESFAVTASFAGSTSPARDTRLLDPGERVRLVRRPRGWVAAHSTGTTVDDLVTRGIARRGEPREPVLDEAADAVAAIIGAAYDLSDGQLTLGLSGGKDSRVLAAAGVAANRVPKLFTNDDVPAEAEAAAALVARLRDRGIEVEHEIRALSGSRSRPAGSLRTRCVNLQAYSDLQYPSAFLIRPPFPPGLPDEPAKVWLSGAAGEIATNYWYPPEPERLYDDRAAAEIIINALLPRERSTPEAYGRQRDRMEDRLRHGRGLGLRGAEVVNWAYLTERLRRWGTAAFDYGTVQPFLAPAFVRAAFTLPPDIKASRPIHARILARSTPEWSDIPFVMASYHKSNVAKIWGGDGLATITALRRTVGGEGLVSALNIATLDAEIASVKERRQRDAVAKQYLYLAMAERKIRSRQPGARPPVLAALGRRVRDGANRLRARG